MENEVAVIPKDARLEREVTVIQGMSVDEAQKQFKALQQFIKSQMQEGQDFGTIPGCKKPSLYKPGSEKLLYFHGLGVKLEPISGETIADWKAPFFNFAYRATVYNPRTGHVIATSDGSCNSKEAKYAYKWVTEKKIPKGFKKEDLVSRDKTYEDRTYSEYRIDVEDPFSQVNTIQKMAQKRAMVGAVLIACRASDIFTTEEEAETAVDKSTEGSQAADKPKSAKPPSDAISEPQLKRLFAIMKEHEVSEEQIKAHVTKEYPYTVDDKGTHLSKIAWKNYEAVCKWVQGKQ